MTPESFRRSLSADEPPEGLPPALVALWHDGRDDWEAAHRVAQDIDGASGAWVHAYLHRKEGDLPNASYWYRRAGKPIATGPPDLEWNAIVMALLAACE